MAEYIVNINEEEVGEFDFIAITTLKEIGIPVVRCEHCAHKKNCQWYYYSGDDYGFCSWAVREEHEQAD